MLTHQHSSTNHQSVLQSSSSNIHQYHSSFSTIIQTQIPISTTPRIHLAHAAYVRRLEGIVRGHILEKPHCSSVHIDGPNPAKELGWLWRVKTLQRTEYLPCINWFAGFCPSTVWMYLINDAHPSPDESLIHGELYGYTNFNLLQ